MSTLPGNLINATSALTERIHNVINSGSTVVLGGIARITNAAAGTQLVIPVVIPSNRKGVANTPMVIPTGSFVFQVAWTVPAATGTPNDTAPILDGVRGTSTDKLKLATAGQGVSATAADSLGGVSSAFVATGLLGALGVGYNVDLIKAVNPFDNAASAVAGLGAFSSTDASRTVNLYSVSTADTAAGSGITVAGLSAGYGFPTEYVDVPVQVYCWLPAPVIPARQYSVGFQVLS
jgi:hypothetical protein